MRHVLDLFHEARIRIVRIAVIKPVDAGQDDEVARPDHLGDLGGKAVVVTDADFLGRDRVVLVHDRHDARFEQAVDGIARVEEAPVILEIAKRQQHLRDVETEFVPNLLVGVEQQRHSAGGCRLLVRHARALRCLSDNAQPQRDRAGRADQHVPALGPERSDIFHQALKETVTGGKQILICQQRGSDFNDECLA